MSIADLLGAKLASKEGEVDTVSALAGKKAVALYFSAHWCPPCRGFTPQLAGWYSEDLKEKGLEIVFCSSDRDEDAFKEYFAEQPWLALPFSDRELKDSLSKKFKVQGIPTVVIVNAESGALITSNGREVLSKDPKGEDMPWIPPSLADILDTAQVVDQAGEKKSLKEATAGKTIAFYFSAHWCPPCRGFTPKFAEWYTKDLKDKGLEVVFCSSDRDEGAFKEYFGEQPWLALPYEDRKTKDKLDAHFGVSGIPSVAIIDPSGDIITKDGRSAISGDPTGLEFPWYPKPVLNLKAGPGDIQETTTVCAFCESADVATQVSIEAAMTPIAERYIAEAKAKGEDSALNFLMVTSSEGLAGRLRGMFKMDLLPPSKHEHPLEKKESTGGWGCDGCSKGGNPEMERFRCTQGCDFDFCGECNAKAGSAVAPLPAQLVICDIPDNGGYYKGPTKEEGNFSVSEVESFVADYFGKKLERQQLG